MLIFMDGFDHYATADITKKWNSNGGTIGVSSGRRSGGAYISGSGSGGSISKTFPASETWVIGFAYRTPTLPTIGINNLLALVDASTVQCSLRLNQDGTLEVLRGSATAVTGGKSILSLSQATFYYIEFKVTIADAIGADTCKVRVNGVDWVTVTTGQDLKASSNATANEVRIGQNSSNGVTSQAYDDLYICDQTGSTNNNFLGDVRIDTIYPTSDGNYSQFTCSTGSSHFALVDEATPNTSDYNAGSTVGDRDCYGMDNLSALVSQTIYGVQVNAALMKDDAGTKSAAVFVRSSSTNDDGASSALGTTQTYVSQVFETDPNGEIAWTETTVNAMEAGVIVTA